MIKISSLVHKYTIWQDENILDDLKLDYINKDKYLDIKSELIKIAKNIN